MRILKILTLLALLFSASSANDEIPEKKFGGVIKNSHSIFYGDCKFSEDGEATFVQGVCKYTALGYRKEYGNLTLQYVFNFSDRAPEIRDPCRPNLPYATKNNCAGVYALFFPFKNLPYIKNLGKYIGIGFGVETDHFLIKYPQGQEAQNSARISFVGAISADFKMATALLSVSPVGLARAVTFKKDGFLSYWVEVGPSELNILTARLLLNAPTSLFSK